MAKKVMFGLSLVGYVTTLVMMIRIVIINSLMKGLWIPIIIVFGIYALSILGLIINKNKSNIFSNTILGLVIGASIGLIAILAILTIRIFLNTNTALIITAIATIIVAAIHSNMK